jgi:UDP-N-acetylmuramyl pentapeptide phosphotransferase/UDP-N-acetylglucosamine-1-phosphate transferase
VTIDVHFFRQAIEVLVPVSFAAFVLFRRSKPFPTWAKAVSIVAAVAGIAAAYLGFLLHNYPQLGVATGDRGLLLRCRFILSGTVGGILISILAAFGKRRT